MKTLREIAGFSRFKGLGKLRFVRSLLVVLVVTVSFGASAQVYTWVDKSGEEHFTDDKSTIPKGVKVRTTEGDELSSISNSAGQENDAPEPPPAAKPKKEHKEKDKGPARVGGRTEEQWRERFDSLRRRQAKLEKEIALDAKVVEEVNGLPITATVTAGPRPYNHFEQARYRLTKNRADLESTKQALLDLDREASNEGVPREWRQ